MPVESATPVRPRPERQRLINAAFASVTLLPQEQRNAYLDEHYPNDPALRAEVAELLDCEGKLGNFLESDSGGFPYSSDASGHVLDRYRLERRLGGGGMG